MKKWKSQCANYFSGSQRRGAPRHISLLTPRYTPLSRGWREMEIVSEMRKSLDVFLSNGLRGDVELSRKQISVWSFQITEKHMCTRKQELGLRVAKSFMPQYQFLLKSQLCVGRTDSTLRKQKRTDTWVTDRTNRKLDILYGKITKINWNSVLLNSKYPDTKRKTKYVKRRCSSHNCRWNTGVRQLGKRMKPDDELVIALLLYQPPITYN